MTKTVVHPWSGLPVTQAEYDDRIVSLGRLSERVVQLESAVDTLRCIAAMGKKAGSEAAKNWLLTHGFPLEEGGYLPGKGFADEPSEL